MAAMPGAPAWRFDVYERGLDWLAEQATTPSLDQLNDWLAPTGWRVIYSDGYVPVRTYQALHRDRVFPISQRLRRLRDLDHSAAPDFIHDVVGHLPLLFDEKYRALLQEWGHRGATASPTKADIDVAEALARLIAAEERDVVDPEEVRACTLSLHVTHAAASVRPSRYSRFETFYTWAIEYGVVTVDRSSKLIGAAALSSFGQLSQIVQGNVAILPFDASTLGRMVNYAVVQHEIFESPSFDDYFDILGAI